MKSAVYGRLFKMTLIAANCPTGVWPPLR